QASPSAPGSRSLEGNATAQALFPGRVVPAIRSAAGAPQHSACRRAPGATPARPTRPGLSTPPRPPHGPRNDRRPDRGPDRPPAPCPPSGSGAGALEPRPSSTPDPERTCTLPGGRWRRRCCPTGPSALAIVLPLAHPEGGLLDPQDPREEPYCHYCRRRGAG